MGEIANMLNQDRLKIRQAGSRALRVVADAHLVAIQKRLDQGKGENNRPFTPYAQSTAARKGRSQPVTLRESGRMRGAMYVRRVRLDQFELTFRDRQSERVARWQHGGTRRRTAADQKRRTPGRIRAGVVFRNTGAFHIPPRPFIGATRQELDLFDKLMEIQVDREFPDDLRKRIKIVFKV